jgi:hypothetical protein
MRPAGTAGSRRGQPARGDGCDPAPAGEVQPYRVTAAQPVITATLGSPVLWPHPPRRMMSHLSSGAILEKVGTHGWTNGTKRQVGTASGREACRGMFASGGRTACICRRCLPAPGKREPRLRAGEGLTVNAGMQEAASPVPEFGQLLLDAKFSVPRPRPGAVSRGDLAETARPSI